MKLILSLIALVVILFILIQKSGKNAPHPMETPPVAKYLQSVLDRPFETQRISAPCFDAASALFRLTVGQTCSAVISRGSSDYRKLRLSLLEPAVAAAEFRAKSTRIETLADQKLTLQRSEQASIVVPQAGGMLAITCPLLASACVISLQ